MAGLSLQQSKFAEAVTTLEGRLTEVSAADLPAALSILGKSQYGLARAESDKEKAKQQLTLAGLNLMRVAVFYQDSAPAAESLFLAGEINTRLDNAAAAVSAYEAVKSKYPRSEFAKKAAAALAASQPKEGKAGK